MTSKGLLYSTEHLDGHYRAGFYINSALAPSYFTISQEEYVKIRGQYESYESYWDGPADSLIIFYDVQAQLDDRERQALEETQFYVSPEAQ